MSLFSELHSAILDDDIATVNRLIQKDPELQMKGDPLGFMPLEIARLLGRKEISAILLPTPPRRIVAIPKGSSKIHSLNEQQYADCFHVEYSSYQYFADYQSFQEVLTNCPWLIANTFLGAENRALGLQFYPELMHARRAPISIRWIDDRLGYGLFADADLDVGDFVMEFTGQVRQLSRRNPTHNEYCFHYPTRFWSWNYYAIDALSLGNEARFINHSDKPNLQPQCVFDRRLLHIVFIAKVAIKTGEQLTYNYGRDFWVNRSKIAL